MFSQRYGLPVRVTRHARGRMVERHIDDTRLLDLIETGTERRRDASHLWLFKSYDDRADNLLCVAAVIQDGLVIKTVMHHFTLEL
jgi:hypothetical protein